MTKKTSVVSFKKVKQIFDHIPNTDLSPSGYSEDRAIAFLKIMGLCQCIHMGDLLSLKKAWIKNSFIETQQLKLKKLASTQVISVPWTPYLLMLLKKFAHDVDSEYVFPYFKLTDNDNIRLQQARAEGDIQYTFLLRSIEVAKMNQFHIRMTKCLNQLSTRLNLSQHITMYAIRTAMIKHYHKPLFHMPTSPADIKDIEAMAEMLAKTKEESLSFIFTPVIEPVSPHIAYFTKLINSSQQ